MTDRTEREIELTSIIAELKVVQGRVTGNIDLTADDKRCIGGPLADAIADAEYNLQAVMDERIGTDGGFYRGDEYAEEAAMQRWRSGVCA